MTPPEFRSLLVEFTAERRELLARHETAARAVPEYDSNNTCQYIIAREDTQLSWLQRALDDLAAGASRDGGHKLGSSTDPRSSADNPSVTKGSSASVLEAEAGELRAFVERWRERVAAVTNSRHRLMLGVILGESLEHARLLSQAAAGRTDVLGRRQDGARPEGRVLAGRWVE